MSPLTSRPHPPGKWSPRARIRASRRLRALRLFAGASPGLFAAAIGFVLAEGILPILALVLLGRAIGLIPAAVTSGIGSHAGHRLVWGLLLGGAAYALSLLRGPVEDLLTTAVADRMSAVLQTRLVRAVGTPAEIDHLEDPEVLDRLASARGELTGQGPARAPMAVLSLLGDQLSGIFACLVIATFRWWLGLALLIAWATIRRPLRSLIAGRAGMIRKAGPALRRSWYLLGLLSRRPAAQEVRIFGLGDWLADRHAEEWTEGMAPSWRELHRLSLKVAWMSVGVLAAYALAAGTLGHAALHHAVSLRTIATVLPMLPVSLNVGSISLADIQVEQMLSALPDVDRLLADLAPPTADPTAPRASSAPVPTTPQAGSTPVPTTPQATSTPVPTTPQAGGTPSGNQPSTPAGSSAGGLPRRSIRFDAVALRYPSGTQALAGVDLELPSGSSLGLVGLNGAGKTTLVSLLAGLRRPTAGRILIDGTPLTRLDVGRWQQQVAVVYQDSTRFPFTAAENVALALGERPIDDTALARAADRAGASDLIAGLPGGWETVLSPRYAGGHELSGGQWQRIVLARALYAVECGARVLVLDEPTSQLDVRSEAAFYDRFLEITAGTTSIVISHRFSTVRRADRIAVLSGGVVTELGDHDALLAAGGTYAEMFTIQSERFAPTARD
ncbi:MAG TPA: ABC transporter ATP-binding protein [Solirubrobacteraceae bacterium]